MTNTNKIKLKDCGSILRECAIESRKSESGMYFFDVENFLDGLQDGRITKEFWERFEQDIKKYDLYEKESGAIELYTDFDSFKDDKDSIDCVFICYNGFEEHFEYEHTINDKFPDDNFRKVIVEQLLDRHDGTLDVFESDLELLKKVETLNIEKHEISDLTGIEYFESLRKLDISHNPLDDLDVSNLSGLKELYAYECQLVNVDLPKTETLETLDVTLNNLESLDLEKQSVLSSLSCSANSLSGLYIDQCPCLEELYCSNNFISDLDLSHNEVLRHLECENNQLTSLVIEDIDRLEIFNIGGNLKEKNELLGYKVVNDLFPDENFRKAILEDVCFIKGESDITDHQLKKIRQCERLLVANSKIKDLTGLDEFKALKVLDVAYNPIKNLDVANIDTLHKLYAFNCDLSEISIPNENVTKLRYLDVSDNHLSNLDLTGQSFLTDVYVSNNNLQTIQLSECDNLKSLSCHSNNLKEIDVSDCYDLISLECDNNNLSKLNLEYNDKLKLLALNNNDLVELDVSHCTNLEILDCANNRLESLNVKGLEHLERVSCIGNQRSSNELLNDRNNKPQKRRIKKVDKTRDLER